MEIEVFTDGGCSGNPGPGGWAYILLIDGGKKTGSGGAIHTTNNRMELIAVISALASIKSLQNSAEASITLTTDSQYVQKGITQWMEGWIRRGWKTSGKTPVKNTDLWKLLKELNDNLTVSWRWVRGHSGHIYNEECDGMVAREIVRISQSKTEQ